ncbi:hypothetical protein ACJJTC_003492 [Scirpophaga incertulas]
MRTDWLLAHWWGNRGRGERADGGKREGERLDDWIILVFYITYSFIVRDIIEEVDTTFSNSHGHSLKRKGHLVVATVMTGQIGRSMSWGEDRGLRENALTDTPPLTPPVCALINKRIEHVVHIVPACR